MFPELSPWWIQTLTLIGILSFCSFLQATIGFAAAMIGIPLLLWAGFSMPEAQIMVITAMFPQNLFAFWNLRSQVRLPDLALPATIRTAMVPVGSVTMAWLIQGPKELVNQAVGAILLTLVITQWVASARGKLNIHSGDRLSIQWLWIAFSTSGFLQGFCGISAIPMVLWCNAKNWSVERMRPFLFGVYLASFLPQWIVLALQFGELVLWAGVRAVLTIPFVLVGSLLGLRLGSRMPESVAKQVTYFALVILALSDIAQPYILGWLRGT